MFFRIAVLFASALLINQILALSSTYDDAYEAVESARKAIEVAIDAGLEITEHHLSKMNQLNQTDNGNYEEIDLKFGMYLKVLDHYDQLAEEQSVNVNSCNGSYANVTSLYANLSNANVCLVNIVEVMEGLHNTTHDLRNYGDIVYDLLDEIDNCAGDETCLKGVIKNAYEIKFSVPKTIIQEVTTNELNVFGSTNKNATCTKLINDAFEGAYNLTSSAITCYYNLLV